MKLLSCLGIGVTLLFLAPAICPQNNLPVSSSTSQMLPHTGLIDSLTKEAEAADSSEGMKSYSEHLVELLIGDHMGDAYATALARRLSMSELMMKHGKRKLVPESSVVQAFNGLMQQVKGNSNSFIKTDISVVHQFRLAIYNTSPILSSVDSHQSDCFPSEAVLLMILLQTNNGVISTLLPAPSIPQSQHPGAPLVQSSNPDARSLILRYSLSHSHSDNVKLYDSITGVIGF